MPLDFWIKHYRVMQYAVIIPTYNEAENIGSLLAYLEAIAPRDRTEILVVDGGSQDNTIQIAARYEGVRVLRSPQQGRAAQMNYGAAQSTAPILQFVHADTRPPRSNFEDIALALEEGYDAGCFTYQFDSSSLLLRINAFFTRFDRLWCRGGDQAIFCTRATFEALGGYRSDFMIMEEYDWLERLYAARYRFKIVKQDCLVSARKYTQNSYWRVQMANLKVFKMYRRGASQEAMAAAYRAALRPR